MTCLDGLAFPGQALSSLPYMGTHRNLTALSMPLEDGSATQMALLGPAGQGPAQIMSRLNSPSTVNDQHGTRTHRGRTRKRLMEVKRPPGQLWLGCDGR